MHISTNDKQKLQKLKNHINKIYPTKTLEDNEILPVATRLNGDAAELLILIDQIIAAEVWTSEFTDNISSWLSNRWNDIKDNSDYRYDTAFSLPLNQFINSFCETIKSYIHKGRYEIMVPQLTSLQDICSGDIDSLQLGDIIFTGEDNDDHIDLPACLELTANEENDFHLLLHNNKADQPELDNTSVSRLKARDPFTNHYLNHLSLVQNTVASRLTLFQQLINLRQGLKRGDSIHGNGGEYQAGEKAYEALANWNEYFNRLNAKQQKFIEGLRHYKDTFSVKSFKEFWQRVSIQDIETVNDSRSTRPRQELSILNCLYLQGQNLEEIINANRHRLCGKLITFQQHELLEQSTQLVHNHATINKLIAALLDNNNDVFIEEFQHLLEEEALYQSGVIDLCLQLVIDYRAFLLLPILLENLIDADFNFSESSIIEDILKFVPNEFITPIIDTINLTQTNASKPSFLVRLIHANRGDIFNCIFSNHPDLLNYSIYSSTARTAYSYTVAEYALDSEQRNIVYILLSNCSREQFNDLLQRAADNHLFLACKIIGDFLREHSDVIQNFCPMEADLSSLLRRTIQQDSEELLYCLLPFIPTSNSLSVLESLIASDQTHLLRVMFAEERFWSIMNTRLPNGDTLLTFAMRNANNESTARCLIELANPNVDSIHPEQIDINLHSASVSLTGQQRISYPIIEAAKRKWLGTIELLINRGVNKNVLDSQERNYVDHQRHLPNKSELSDSSQNLASNILPNNQT